MTSLTNRVLTQILLIWLCTAFALCPLDCFCRLDAKGRRKTSCLQGGMIGPLPTAMIDKETQILEIQPPFENPNWLLIGAIFKTLTSLEELYILRSNVPEIGKHSFWGLKSLEVLNLIGNNISQLQDHNFRGLANLKELYLDDNQIEQLTTGGFKYLTDLRILSLARNRLEEVDARVFERLGKLQRLNLSGNKLKELYPEVFMDIQELRVFECRSCNLRNINTQIYHLLPNLISLDLGDNDFFYLTNDEFYDLRKLKYLWLDGNHLPVVLERTFVMQKELLKVDLSRNRLAKVTNTAFANVTTLKELDISYNKLIRIEPVVFHPISDSLERLDLSGNNLVLSELKYSLQGLNNLQYLGLSDLNLTEIPLGLFNLHDKIQRLNLSGNLIDSFPSDFKMNLKELDLSRNKFVGLQEESMQSLERINAIHLQDNPWSCDLCNIVPLLARVNKSSIGFYIRTLKCASPFKLRSKLLQNLRESDLLSCHELDQLEANDNNFFTNLYRDYGHIIIIIVTTVSVLILLFGSIAIVRVCCFSRTPQNYYLDDDKIAEKMTEKQIEKHVRASHSNQDTILVENATAIFGQNGEISFKFPLELTEKKRVEISTIDDIKKETRLSSIPNGEL